jgi:hypothetical protein
MCEAESTVPAAIFGWNARREVGALGAGRHAEALLHALETAQPVVNLFLRVWKKHHKQRRKHLEGNKEPFSGATVTFFSEQFQISNESEQTTDETLFKQRDFSTNFAFLW